MKKFFSGIIKAAGLLVVVTAALTVNCSWFSTLEQTDSDALIANTIAGAMGALSGSCVVTDMTITQDAGYNTGEVHSYVSVGYGVPKGGCNETTMVSGGYFTTADAAKAYTDSVLDKAIAAAGHTECTNTKAGLEASKASITAAGLTAASDAAFAGIAAPNAVCYNLATLNPAFSGFLCKTADDIARHRLLRQYRVVTDLKSDMGVSLSAARTTAQGLNSVLKFSDAALLNIRFMNSSELTVAKSANFMVWTVANAGEAACALKIEGSDAGVKSLITATAGGSQVAKGATFTAITEEQVAAVTNYLVSAGQCSMTYNMLTGVRTNGTYPCPAYYPAY